VSAAGGGSAGDEVFASAASHGRAYSYDILGDVDSRLGNDMLALLELHDGHAQPAALAASAQQEAVPDAAGALERDVQHAPALAVHTPGGAAAEAGDGSAAGAGGGSTPRSASSSLAALSRKSAPIPTSRYNFLDLGGASWGVDAAAVDGASSSDAAREGSGSLDRGELLTPPGGAAVTLAGSGSRQGSGLWRSSLGPGLDSPTLPPPGPRGLAAAAAAGAAAALRLGSAGQRSLTEDGSGALQLGTPLQGGPGQGSAALSGLSSERASPRPVGACQGALPEPALPEPALLQHSLHMAGGPGVSCGMPPLATGQQQPFVGASEAAGYAWLQQEQIVAIATQAAVSAVSALAAAAQAHAPGAHLADQASYAGLHQLPASAAPGYLHQQQQQQQLLHLQFLQQQQQQQQQQHVFGYADQGLATTLLPAHGAQGGAPHSPPPPVAQSCSSFAFGAPGVSAFSSTSTAFSGGFRPPLAHNSSNAGDGSSSQQGSTAAASASDSSQAWLGTLELLPDDLNLHC
jgi:hypothetical protein